MFQTERAALVLAGARSWELCEISDFIFNIRGCQGRAARNDVILYMASCCIKKKVEGTGEI